MLRLMLLFLLVAGLVACAGETPTPAPAFTLAPTQPAPAASPTPAPEALLIWHRSGGLAGFCDVLTASTRGNAEAAPCNAEGRPAVLTAEELLQLRQWAEAYGPVVIVMGDPAVADALFTTLELNGRGAGQPTEPEQQRMLAWAQAVYVRLQTQP